MKRKPPRVADYLAGVDKDKRAALVRLREVIRAAAPEAEECIAYGIPAYRVQGKVTVALGTGRNHCAFYTGSTPLEKYKRELARYETRRAPCASRPTARCRRRSCAGWSEPRSRQNPLRIR